MGETANKAYNWAGDNQIHSFVLELLRHRCFGLPALGGPLNILAGATGIGKADARNADYAQRRADAERSVTAYKKANEANPNQTTVASPTSDQWILSTGGGVPQQKQDAARQTVADVSAMSQQAQQRRADAFKAGQTPLASFRPPQQMGGQPGGQCSWAQQPGSALHGMLDRLIC